VPHPYAHPPAGVLQLAERTGLGPVQCGFESHRRHAQSYWLSNRVVDDVESGTTVEVVELVDVVLDVSEDTVVDGSVADGSGVEDVVDGSVVLDVLPSVGGVVEPGSVGGGVVPGGCVVPGAVGGGVVGVTGAGAGLVVGGVHSGGTEDRSGAVPAAGADGAWGRPGSTRPPVAGATMAENARRREASVRAQLTPSGMVPPLK
jgi:hypothetical protein